MLGAIRHVDTVTSAAICTGKTRTLTTKSTKFRTPRILLLQTLVLVLCFETSLAKPTEVGRAFEDIFQNKKIGCLYSDQVCNEEEVCHDDSIFGRCISPLEELEGTETSPLLSEDEIGLLSFELDKLLQKNFQWTDIYTQCTLQNAIQAILYGAEMDDTLCTMFLPAEDDDDDGDDDDKDDDDNARVDKEETETGDNNNDGDEDDDENEDGGGEEEEEEEANIVPKKMAYNSVLFPGAEDAEDAEDEDDFRRRQLKSYEASRALEARRDELEGNRLLPTPYLTDDDDADDADDGGVAADYLQQLLAPNDADADAAREYYHLLNGAGAGDYRPVSEADFLPRYPAEEEAGQNQYPEVIFPGEGIGREYLEDLLMRRLPVEEEQQPGYDLPSYFAEAADADADAGRRRRQDLPSYALPLAPTSDVRKLRKRGQTTKKTQDESIAQMRDDLDLDDLDLEGRDLDLELIPVEGTDQRDINQQPDGLYYVDEQDNIIPLTPEDVATLMAADADADADSNLLPADYDYPDSVVDGAELFYLPDSDAPSSSEEAPAPAAQVQTLVRPGAGGLGSHIFNRRERLDVKKPGPFYQNSANNFYLDKLLNTDYDDNYTGGHFEDSKNNETDVGQLEYEMPLLAPSKDKRLLPVDLALASGLEAGSGEAGSGEAGNRKQPRFVHIRLDKRFDTWQQGSDFVDYLAGQFGLPAHALADKIIENQHVQFRVDPNPQNIDAVQMAKKIDSDVDLRSDIDSHLGVSVARAGAGDRNDVSSITPSYPSADSLNLLILVVVSVSTLAAVCVIGVVLLLVRKRDRINRKKQELIDQERGRANDAEYQQLCRDWKKTGSKLDSTSAVASASTSAIGPGSGSGSGNNSGGAGNTTKAKLQQRESKESNTGSDRSSTSSWVEEPNNTNMDISTGHMVLAYMEDHLNNKQRLEQEWVGLCGYEADPCATTIAFKAENKKKNRYPDKLPYDHNRVILNAMVNGSSSDYVNASAVTDHDPRCPSYIVTQGPLSNTVADFWQMVWEQGCVVIVMLSRLQDNAHQLCHRYWPEQGSEQYHIFEVHLVSEHVWCEDYLVRSVYLKNTRTGETRTVTQFHFRSWPAHGVPTSTKALLEFRRKVNKSYRGRSCPICVHCSDGVGRSGTYVLIDMVLNRMSKGAKEIDIAATLEHIRDQRGGMVQSKQQFEFCLMAVAEEVHAILKAMPQ